MGLIFHPNNEDIQKGSIRERIEALMEGAQTYKATILDPAYAEKNQKVMVPRDQAIAYNWDAIAKVLREIREMQEGTRTEKHQKANLLAKLAEIYEVLRDSKMPKLEGVRQALISEANLLIKGR